MSRQKWYTPKEAKTIGKRIKARRLELELSQRALAEPCQGVSYAYVSRLEAGQRHPTTRALRELARPLQTTATWLEFGVDAPDPEKAADYERALREIAALFAEQPFSVSETAAKARAIALEALGEPHADGDGDSFDLAEVIPALRESVAQP